MKRIFTLLALAALALTIFAQSPDLMTYQAVLRDAENHLLTNQAVAIQISILQGTPNGASVYTEIHAVTTNDNGLVSLEIGDGVSGDDFSLIDWSSGPFYIKTETDPAGGSNYTITSTSQLLSVPYSKYADAAGNVFSGDYGDLAGAPVNVSAFTNDAGYLSSELWSLNGNDIYYQGGNVVIGTNTPGYYPLTINQGASNTYGVFQNNASGISSSDGFLLGIKTDLSSYLWNYEAGPIRFGTSASQRMIIDSDGHVGIGTSVPTANLHVEGGTKIGSSGVTFNELREITGTTGASGTGTSIALPSGYTAENTRVLSYEIKVFGTSWFGLGSHFRALPAGSLYNQSYIMVGTTLYVYYPNDADYHSRDFRVLIMQIAP